VVYLTLIANSGVMGAEMVLNIRPTKREDITALKAVLDETELFPSELLPDMLADLLSGTSATEIWLTVESGAAAAGFCYAAPEKLTDGTWNMLAIAVSPSRQGQGLGHALVKQLEDILRKAGQRILIADTSGTSQFAQTREFYRKCGYHEEARIREFWAEGDDKVTFRKAL
jgi:ribosomal protein S18 acetylase RimI-like enzyme